MQLPLAWELQWGASGEPGGQEAAGPRAVQASAATCSRLQPPWLHEEAEVTGIWRPDMTPMGQARFKRHFKQNLGGRTHLQVSRVKRAGQE